MSYKLVTIPTARKSLKKLPRHIRADIVRALQGLSDDPYLGEILRGEFRQLRSYHLKLQNVQYRVVYHVLEDKQEVVVIYADSRENFYRDLKQLNIKELLRQL